MPETVVQGITQDQVLAILAAQNLGDVGTYTLATLPDPALWPRRTCWVTDMFGVGGRMVSEGGFWKAIRPLIAGNATSATMMTIPFSTPATLILTGSLAIGITHNVTLGMGSGFAVPSPGYRQRIRKPIGALGTLNVIGALTVALTGWADFEFDGSAWQQTASGGIL